MAGMAEDLDLTAGAEDMMTGVEDLTAEAAGDPTAGVEDLAAAAADMTGAETTKPLSNNNCNTVTS